MKKNTAQPETKRKLLDAATKLMLKKGFTSTTVDEICEEAGVTKGSFFHYFESKESLTEEALHAFCDFQGKLMEGGAFNAVTDPLKRLYGYLDFFVTVMKNPDIPKSCLVGNLTQELSKTHPKIRSICADNFEWHVKKLKQLLDDAKKIYAPSSSFDTKSLAECFIALFQGSLILAKATQDTKVIEKNIRHFKRYVENIFSQKKDGQ